MMTTRKSRQGIIFLVLLTLGSFWLSHKNVEERKTPVTDLDQSIDYVLQNFNLQIFDTSGRLTLNLHAPLFRNNPVMKLGTIDHPVIALEQSETEWALVAERATMTEDRHHIHLFGHVIVQRFETATGNHTQMNTREIEVEIPAQTASTAEPVSLSDGRNHMQALGMDLDIKSGRFQLRQNVKASYAVD